MSTQDKYPIVLAHGIARFDFLRDSLMKRLSLFLADLNFVPDRTHYFKGIATHLKKHGFEVYHSSVAFAAGVEDRAKDLKREVERILETTGHQKVHIIGHSMGGLDSRQMIVQEDMAHRVASLTSIGTPHLGTSLAQWVLSRGGEGIIQSLQETFDLKGFLTLTAEKRAAFNESARNAEAFNDVLYQTYAGWQDVAAIFTPLKASWKIIFDAEGENDGLVPVTSQRWVSELISDNGKVKKVRQHDFPVPADHLNQIGWWDVSELARLKWWRVSLFRQKRDYELAIKNAYLKIAGEVTAAVAGDA